MGKLKSDASDFKGCDDTNILLTTWSRVLQKLIVAQLVKKFPSFHET
jgi:hypothetical protein